jgi:nitrogen permease regulator 3-like protein
MLQRDLLVTLRLRVRIVVPAALKVRVRHRRETLREHGWHTEEDEDAFRTRGHKARIDSGASERDLGLFDAPPAWYMQHSPSLQHRDVGMGETMEPPILDEGIEFDEEMEKEEAEAEAEAASRREGNEMEDDDDDNETSILMDPGRATSLQRRWLQGMSEGKDELVARRFDQYVARCIWIRGLGLMEIVHRINQYFDGKCTDDEILFRAEISKRQLREVLHLYDEYVGISR